MFGAWSVLFLFDFGSVIINKQFTFFRHVPYLYVSRRRLYILQQSTVYDHTWQVWS